MRIIPQDNRQAPDGSGENMAVRVVKDGEIQNEIGCIALLV
ncbi:MAG TPA: hypothetical protein PKA61_05585 [Nitrospira sp.]|nr:hypothetical protein [Nitrospira sp.]